MSAEPAKVTRILVVEDHVLLREGLVSLLQEQPDFEVVAESGSVAGAVSLTRRLRPDLVLMDYSLPDGTGLEATRAILEHDPETSIVFLTVHEADDNLFAAIRSGARGYLLKNVSTATLLQKLRGWTRGEPPLSGESARRLLAAISQTGRPQAADPDRLAELTERELEVLCHVARGASNKEIADTLVISVYTVKNHVHSILAKLEVGTRQEAARIAADHGLS